MLFIDPLIGFDTACAHERVPVTHDRSHGLKLGATAEPWDLEDYPRNVALVEIEALGRADWKKKGGNSKCRNPYVKLYKNTIERDILNYTQEKVGYHMY